MRSKCFLLLFINKIEYPISLFNIIDKEKLIKIYYFLFI